MGMATAIALSQSSQGLKRGILFSFLIHLSVVLFSLASLPSWYRAIDQVPAPIIVDIVPVSDITNLPPPRPKAAAKPAPAIEEKAKPSPKTIEAAPPPRKIEEAVPLPAAKSKTEPKKAPVVEEKPKEQKTANDFASVLKTVEKFKQEKAAPAPETQTPETASSSQGPFVPSLPLSVSEMDAVRHQLEPCWNIPAGARNPEELIVEIRTQLNPDGSLQAAKIVDEARMYVDPFYRAAAESALRALLNPKCMPLKLPPEKYNQWQTTVIVFDPRFMLGF